MMTKLFLLNWRDEEGNCLNALVNSEGEQKAIELMKFKITDKDIKASIIESE